MKRGCEGGCALSAQTFTCSDAERRLKLAPRPRLALLRLPFTCSDAERRLKLALAQVVGLASLAFTCSDAERRLKRILWYKPSMTARLSHAVMPKGV